VFANMPVCHTGSARAAPGDWKEDAVKIAVMSKSGRLTLPAEARRALGLDSETEFEIEVDSAQDALILRPAVVLRREDAWAYTTEHRALLRRAHADSREGRVQQRSEHDLLEVNE